MSTLPPPTPTVPAKEVRERLAGLIDPQQGKQQWQADFAKGVAIQFCASLPAVFGESLDRKTMWDKIAAAIRSGYAKTVSGDIDLFVQHVMESIQADPALAISNERLTAAVDKLQELPEQQRQDWLQYLVTHLIPVLVHARREHKKHQEVSR